MNKKTYYITTPIYYPSDKLHIGHSYTTVAADAMARFKRLKGFDVMFLTGTDEHGQKIQERASEKGVEPQTFVDNIVSDIKKLWETMKITNDKFIRTTDTQHKAAVQKIFKKLYDQGDIYKSEYEGWYCTPCESFWTKTQAVDGKCPDCGRDVKLTREESYFFKLSKYQDQLVEYYEKHSDFIEPNSRLNEMINNFIKPGLEDLAVSRTSFDWGVKVDFDPKHVVYVWIDALSNYITALGYGSDNDADYKKYWPADVHLVGKEIVRFHTIIWPSMLMALGEPLPKKIFGHGWLLLEGGKMSKSKGNVVDPAILIEKYGLDSIRYFLLREVPFGSDGVFSNEALINRINSDLANDLGNLVSRTIAMIEKYFDGTIPAKRQEGDFDEDLKSIVCSMPDKVEKELDNMQFNIALSEIWKAISRANKYIDETMPWVLAKSDENKPRLAQVMYNLAETLRIVSIMIEPFMPETPDKIQEQLGLKNNEKVVEFESAWKWGGYPEDTEVVRGGIIFPRIDLVKEMEALESLSKNNDKDKVKDSKQSDASDSDGEGVVTIDQFTNVQLKVAQVLEADKVEKSDKLLKLQLDIGTEKRQVVSGIALHYTPESLIGKKLVLVSNLKPAKLRGIESQGMILAASKGDKLVLVILDGDMENGATVS